jgi:hypothetical protein
MSILQAMGLCHLGGLLARESGHRDGPADFATRHCGSHTTGQRERRRQPKQQSCKTPIHGRSFHCLLMPARERADYGEMRFEEGKISVKEEHYRADKNLAEYAAEGAGSLCTLHGPQRILQRIDGRSCASGPHQRRIHGAQLALDKSSERKDRSVLITAL